MVFSINRDGVCMGDDAMDHRREITLEDNAVSCFLMGFIMVMLLPLAQRLHLLAGLNIIATMAVALGTVYMGWQAAALIQK